MPQSILDFVQAPNDGQTIHVLVINAGMINSDTSSKKYDRAVFDQFNTPLTQLLQLPQWLLLMSHIAFQPHKRLGVTFKVRWTVYRSLWCNIQ